MINYKPAATTLISIPSDRIKNESLNFPSDDNDTSLPSTVTSATFTLSEAIPLIIPLYPMNFEK